MVVTFPDLPVEVITSILELVSPTDVVCAALASRSLYSVYSENRSTVVAGSLRNHVPKQLWHEFCAAQVLLAHFHPVVDTARISADVNQVQDFLAVFFDPSREFKLLTEDRRHLGLACKLYGAVSYFVEAVAARAFAQITHFHCRPPQLRTTERLRRVIMREQPRIAEQLRTRGPDADYEPFTVSSLSGAERHRLFRGILRHEIYARLFRPPQSYRERPVYSGEFQFWHFLQHFAPWEVEEVVAVHRYFVDVVMDAVKDMGRAFEARIKEHIQRAIVDDADDEAKGWADIALLFPNVFYYFSAEFRRSGSGGGAAGVSALVGSGLFSMLTLARGDAAVRSLFLRANSTCVECESQFLSCALNRDRFSTRRQPSPVLRARQEWYSENEGDADEDGTGRASTGYNAYFSLGPGGYGSFQALWWRTSKRRMGVVFWDAQRFETTTLQRAFPGIKAWEGREGEQEEEEENRSPEENLLFGPVPVPYVRELTDAFGPIG